MATSKQTANLLAALLLLSIGLMAQSTGLTGRHKVTSKSIWHDDQIAVQSGKPYISTGGLLLLEFTLTNKTGSDLVICREGDQDSSCILMGVEEAKLFRKLKRSGTHDEISENDHSIVFFKTSLPAAVPVRFVIAFELPKQEQSWWAQKEEPTPKRAIRTILADVDAIVLLIPSRRIRVTLPVSR